jgi:hypothetical protein
MNLQFLDFASVFMVGMTVGSNFLADHESSIQLAAQANGTLASRPSEINVPREEEPGGSA